MIITVCGFIGSGKDTIADFLVDDWGFRRDSFANSLKDAVSAVFGWDRVLLEGRTEEARRWREEVDTWWAKRLNIPHLTPRWVLQQWGTEVCRVNFHQDIWVASLENRLIKSGGNVVISDCRFYNEVQAMRNIGAKTVRVRRGPEPTWYNLGVSASNPNDANQLAAQQTLKAAGIHASEWSWLGTNFDCIIENNGSLADLRSKVNQLVTPAISELEQFV